MTTVDYSRRHSPLVVPPTTFPHPLSSPRMSRPAAGDDKELSEPSFDALNRYFSAMPMSPRQQNGYPPDDLSYFSAGSQIGLLRATTGRHRGYSDASTSSDVSASSFGLRTRQPTISQQPAGVGEAPKSNDNSALQGIWDTYRKEAGDYDAAMIASWNGSIDTLILFAGLFSAIITTFVIESYKSLAIPRPVPHLSHPADEVCRMFGCGPHATRVNTMWFTSLGLSLVSALTAMLIKQWIAAYKVDLSFSGTGSSESYHQACRLRQFRYDGMRKYKMEHVIAATPILLHAALLCFGIGLIDFLWNLNRPVAIPISCLCGLTLFLYIGSTVSAVVSPRSPYKTALARLICGLRGGGLEDDHVKAAGTQTDEHVVEWLITMSRSQDIHKEAMVALMELRRSSLNDSRAA